MWEVFEKLPTPFSAMGCYNYVDSQDTTLRLPYYSTMIGYCKTFPDRQHFGYNVL